LPDYQPVNAITMGGIARDAGLTIEEFRDTLMGAEMMEGNKEVRRICHLQKLKPCGRRKQALKANLSRKALNDANWRS